MDFTEYLYRAKERIYTIAFNNILNCQINYRAILLQAIVNNVLDENIQYEDKFRIDYISVFETDENYEDIDLKWEDQNRISKIADKIYNHNYRLVFCPIYKELWNIEYIEDIKNY